mmetsp:Transcript_28812/g.43499  ORF Transcript_28812/g.43499 Transcript_28812/m.43499 type:complete len:162 (+) Transcript_28812:1709-2194(+)
MWLGPKASLLKHGADPSLIIFLNSGEVEVGYNVEFYLYEAGFKEMKEVSAFKKLISKKWNKSSLEPSRASSYQNNHLEFPVTLKPGSLIVGLFEMAYAKKSQFLYRSKEDSPGVSCMFIRKEKWASIIAATDKSAAIFEDFKARQVVNSYLSSVYIPIKRY